MELSVKQIKEKNYPVRGFQVVLDHDLAEFYHTETRTLNFGKIRPPACGRSSEGLQEPLQKCTSYRSSVFSEVGKNIISYEC